jgi:UDP-GlcNAc:undecaprenyl-phosphate GlcNAc-1-phosphate transferase
MNGDVSSRLFTFFFSFLLAFALALYLTPLMRKAALKFGLVDRPDGRLKKHKDPVAYLGGIAIYLSFLIALALVFQFSQEILGILLSTTLVLLLGIVDDFGVLEPKIKFLGQLLAALVLVKCGIRIQLVFLPDYISIPLSIIWLIGITNAFNIIDIMDGLSAGVGFVSAVVLFLIAFMNNRHIIATLTIVLAGSLLGFLRYNFHPASIYMGDAGSMFIGLMLGTLAMIGSYTQHNWVAALAPVVILGIPIFDTLFVMYIRLIRRVPVFFGSPDHFALRLRKWRLTIPQTVALSYGIALVLGFIAIGIMFIKTNYAAGLILAFVVLAGLIVAKCLKKIDVNL